MASVIQGLPVSSGGHMAAVQLGFIFHLNRQESDPAEAAAVAAAMRAYYEFPGVDGKPAPVPEPLPLGLILTPENRLDDGERERSQLALQTWMALTKKHPQLVNPWRAKLAQVCGENFTDPAQALRVASGRAAEEEADAARRAARRAELSKQDKLRFEQRNLENTAAPGAEVPDAAEEAAATLTEPLEPTAPEPAEERARVRFSAGELNKLGLGKQFKGARRKPR